MTMIKNNKTGNLIGLRAIYMPDGKVKLKVTCSRDCEILTRQEFELWLEREDYSVIE